MALHDPVAAYNAANYVEAHLLRNLLTEAGIEAHVIEDVSQVGTWMFGLLPEIHKPQVWIERTDAERARPILEDYERRAAERRRSGTANQTAEEPPIEAVCEECGQPSRFPAARRGKVEECPHCGAYMDVGREDWPEESLGTAEDEEGIEEA